MVPDTFRDPLADRVVKVAAVKGGVGIALEVGCPVGGVDKKRGSNQELMCVEGGVRAREGVKIEVLGRVKFQATAGNLPEHGANRIMFNGVFRVAFSAEAAMAPGLESSFGAPAIPYRPKNRPVDPWSGPTANEMQTIPGAPRHPIGCGLFDRQVCAGRLIVTQKVPPSEFIPDPAFGVRCSFLK